MLDLRWIRENGQALDRALESRGSAPVSAALLLLDKGTRALKSALQQVAEQKNVLAQQTAQGKALQQDVSVYIEQAAALKGKEAQLSQELAVSEEKLQAVLASLPNIPAQDVPEGKDEEQNREVRRVGVVKDFPNVKDHMALAEGVGGIDMSAAVHMSGSRFVLLKGALARLERALAHWMLDRHIDNGYTEIAPPYMVNEKAAFGSGNLPKFADDLFQTTDGRFLIPTAEMPLCSLYAEKILDFGQLPLRLTALTPCFRLEAGASGRDTHGMMRLHQFRKVELFSMCGPDQAEAEHERIVAQAETLLQLLDLPYRVIVLCTGDMGFSAKKTYDIEVYVPSQQKYREISSCSNCGDFQGRRTKTRYRDKEGQVQPIHMLNGSGLPTGRTMIAVLEHYQNADGSITVPEVLRPYMQGMDCIR